MVARDTSIPERMHAVQCHGVQDYRLEEIDVPQVGEKELLVKVERCGLCAGDAKCYRGTPRFWGNDAMPRYVETPVVPGHEFVGVVVAAGFGALQHHRVELGDRVIAEQVLACRECLYCRRGMRWLCLPHDIFGFKRKVNGGVAEFMIFPALATVYKIPQRVPPQEAVYVEPLSCSVNGVERGNIAFGDTVVIAGCGPIGLGMIAAAKMKSPARVIALDCVDSRLDIARECGADVLLNANKEDVVAAIHAMTEDGCDVYIEATGNPKGVVQGLAACRKAGTFVEFSVFKGPTTVDWTVIGDLKELNIKGGHCSGDRGYNVAIDMIQSGRLPMEKIVTHALPLCDTVKGLEMVDAGATSSTGAIKVTIDPFS